MLKDYEHIIERLKDITPNDFLPEVYTTSTIYKLDQYKELLKRIDQYVIRTNFKVEQLVFNNEQFEHLKQSKVEKKIDEENCIVLCANDNILFISRGQ